MERQMERIRIFVTGATGYIGGSVAARLVSDGHAVTGLARDHRGVERNRKDVSSYERYERDRRRRARRA
ncbi:protein of unknown function [Burkholderia multivorans]